MIKEGDRMKQIGLFAATVVCAVLVLPRMAAAQRRTLWPVAGQTACW
jgi:hypothetical protein